ncbi:MAG: SRPBCC domain-containing protein [Planctomycetes bacterium]|nr:SRPBCC domain-containing protein [Planctomycetota bacterium]
MSGPGEVSASVTVERVFETPIDVVWATLTRAEILSAWFHEGAEVNLVPGGHYRDGEGDAGEYAEIEELRRLALTWRRAGGADARLAFTFVDESGNTRLRVELSNLAGEEERARQAEFWHWAYDSLDAFLKTGFGIPYGPWREMQAELHRRAALKSAEEAAAERLAAGVVLAPLADKPVLAPEKKVPAKPGRKKAAPPNKKKTSAKRAPAKKAPKKPARRKRSR